VRGRIAAALLLLVGCARQRAEDALGAVVPRGFDTTTVVVHTPSGDRRLCMFLADTQDKRDRGLMGVTSLGKRDGMIFRFGGPSRGAFYMYKTIMPLHISFWDERGGFVSSDDMEPCTSTDQNQCERTNASGDYNDAIEIPGKPGLAADLGLIETSTITIGTSGC
jgi:uncharacterized membrane protein (UPF0127 family)